MIPFLYGLVCLIWGSTWLAIKFGLDGVPPFLGAGLRFSLAAAILWGLVFFSGLSPRLTPRGRRAAVIAGVLGFGIGYSLVYWAETRVSSGLVAVLCAVAPLITALLTAFVARTETLTRRKGAGIAIGIAGVVVLFWPREGVASADALGLLAAFVSSVGSAGNLVAQSLWSKKDDARVLNAWSMSLGAALLLGLSFVFERGAAVTWTPSNVGAIFYLAILGTVVAFLSYYKLIRALPATQVSMITLIFPVVAIVLGWVVLGESLTANAGFGIALIMGGVGLALAKRRQSSPAI
ncbi:MAG: DMT family transporter [Elusimicrobia bacterium]|nr:DMT family transporter [Elusimicrobiota bacterium]